MAFILRVPPTTFFTFPLIRSVSQGRNFPSQTYFADSPLRLHTTSSVGSWNTTLGHENSFVFREKSRRREPGKEERKELFLP